MRTPRPTDIEYKNEKGEKMKKIVTVIIFVTLSLLTLNAKSYKYDDLNRVIEVGYESGEKIYYAYDSAGNMLDVRVVSGTIEGYHLNTKSVTNTAVVMKIQDTISNLENIKDAINTNTDYNVLKSQLDEAMSKVDAIKQAIDDNIIDNDEKIALKNEADKIKREIDAIKILIDGFGNVQSQTEIDTIVSKIHTVIGMMIEDGSVAKEEISLKAGRNTVSGLISVADLNDDVHSMFIVNAGNWYGYSPHADILKEIKEKYMLIEDVVGNHKGALVYAIRDTTIKSASDVETTFVIHTYPRGYTLHGTDGDSLSVDDIVCEEPNKLVIVAKVRGDVPSVYVPYKTIDGIDNFEYLYANDGYYVLCDKE